MWAVVECGPWSSVGRGPAWTVVELGLRKYVFKNKSVSDLSHRTAKRQQFNGQNHFCLVKFFHRLLTYIFVSDGINSVADYDSTPCGVVRRRRCRRWREGSN